MDAFINAQKKRIALKIVLFIEKTVQFLWFKYLNFYVLFLVVKKEKYLKTKGFQGFFVMKKARKLNIIGSFCELHSILNKRKSKFLSLKCAQFIDKYKTIC